MIVLVCRYVLSQNAQHENASSIDADLILIFLTTSSDTDKCFPHKQKGRYQVQHSEDSYSSCCRCASRRSWFVLWWPEDRVHVAGRHFNSW